jgi:Na+/H+-dicarboxylate symporter
MVIKKKKNFIKNNTLKKKAEELGSLIKKKLWLKVLIALFLGVFFGFLLGPTIGVFPSDTSSVITEWIALPGYVFLSLIQMIVIPLIFASIIKGMVSCGNINQLKKTGITIVIYFIITTIASIVIGLLVVNTFNPGQFVDSQTVLQLSSEEISTNVQELPTLEKIPSLITGLFPTNVLNSVISGEMLPIIIFTIIFGIALINLKKKQSKPLIDVLSSLQDVCIMIVKYAMVLAPIAVFGLMTKVTSQFGISTLKGLGVYVLCVLFGLFLLILFYMLIISLILKKKPLDFLKKIRDVQLLAFSTSSSAVVMPLSIKTAEEKLKVRLSIAKFIIPIGATINMDGTALYQAIATIFLAQVFSIEISIFALIFLIITIVGASIGTPGTPGVGLVILSMALITVGVPLTGIALILGVDRIVDMFRTAVNVTGDLTAAMFVDKFVK